MRHVKQRVYCSTFLMLKDELGRPALKVSVTVEPGRSSVGSKISNGCYWRPEFEPLFCLQFHQGTALLSESASRSFRAVEGSIHHGTDPFVLRKSSIASLPSTVGQHLQISREPNRSTIAQRLTLFSKHGIRRCSG